MAINLGDAYLKIFGDTSPLERQLSQFAKTAGRIMTVAGVAIAAGLTSAVSAASEYESAFAGVRKTMDESEDSFIRISEAIRDMSEEIPISAKQLARIAELGGQLDIAEKDIVEFTRVMADLRASTNLTSEEQLMFFTQIADQTGVAVEDFHKLGSTVVELGNSTKTNEALIVSMAKKIVGAGAVAGMSADEILGLAGAIASLGVETERGGSAVSRLINTMDTLTDKNDLEGLQIFADVLGVASDTFAEMFRNDPANTFRLFFEGLNKIQESGGSLSVTLEELGIKELRLTEVTKRAALQSGELTRIMGLSNEAFKEGTALSEEAAKRYETFESNTNLLKNSFTNLRIEVGNILLPILSKLIDKVRPHIQQATEWVSNNKELTASILGIVSAITAFLVVAFPMAVLFEGFILALPLIKTAFWGLVGAVSAMAPFLPLIVAGLVTLFAAITGFIDSGAMDALIGHVSDTFGFILDTVIRVYLGVKDKSVELFNSLSELFKVGFELLMALGDTFLGGFSDMWAAAKEETDSFVDGMIFVINHMLTQATTLFNRLRDNIQIALLNVERDFLKNTGKVRAWVAAGLSLLRDFSRGVSMILNSLLHPIQAMTADLNRLINLFNIVSGLNLPSFSTQQSAFDASTSSGGGDTRHDDRDAQRSGGFTTSEAKTSEPAQSIVVDMRGTVIKENADVDTVITKMTNALSTLTQQNGGSTATVGG